MRPYKGWNLISSTTGIFSQTFHLKIIITQYILLQFLLKQIDQEHVMKQSLSLL